MKLTKISLVNFRNYGKLSITLNKGMNIFIGDNAQGKTNILEAISFLSLTKSFRVINEPDLIKFNKEKAIVKGKVKDENSIKELEINLEKGKKNLLINKTPIRRNILNIQISQLSKSYLITYNEYNKILKTRNEYLKTLFSNSLADKSYFDILTTKLISKAVTIYQMRKEYIDLVNENISNIYQKISSSEEKLFVRYEPNVEFSNYEKDYIQEKLFKIYKKNYFKELNNGMTLFGPHRDDFSFYLEDKNLKMYGSQGQQKLAVLSYKISEINIFEKIIKTKPLLLFDDIFSELDIKKRNKLLKYVQEDIQSIITTTDIKNINKKYLNDAYVFQVINGNIIRK